METIMANAALAEMKGIQDAMMQRIVTLAGDLAVCQAELATLRAKVQATESPCPEEAKPSTQP